MWWDDGEHTQDHAEFVESQYRKYLVNMDNSGQTLMWHGLPTKYQVEPHPAAVSLPEGTHLVDICSVVNAHLSLWTSVLQPWKIIHSTIPRRHLLNLLATLEAEGVGDFR